MNWWDSFVESAATRLSSTLSWWQWAILAAIPPAIILLYFLKLKRRPIEVPSTYLWHKSIEDLHVNSIWQRLRNNLLLYLQLLLLLLAALALLRPSFQGRKLLGSRSIFLVDNSASMQANDVGRSRLDEAKARVNELIDEMQTGDVAMIVSFADTAKVEQPFTDDRRRLRQVLDAIQPTQRPTALAEALRVASGLANPGRSGEKGNPADVPVSDALPADLYIFSDGRFGAVGGFSLGNLNPVFVPIGRADAGNVAVAAFNTERGDQTQGKLQAFGRIANYGPEQTTVLVELVVNGQAEPDDSERLTIPAGEGRGVAFDLGDMDSGVLQLRITEKDALLVDNQAWTIINPPRQANVLLVTPGNEKLELAVQTKLIAEVARVQIELPEFLKTPKYQQLAGGGFDVIVFDRCKPEKMPQCNTFFVGELPPESGWKAKETVDVPRIIDVELGHPLMAWLDLGDVQILTGTPLIPPSGGKVLIEADSGPMLAIAPRETYEDAVLGFALIDTQPGKDGKPGTYVNSNWHATMSFPPFVLNLVNYLGGGPKAKAQQGGQPGRAVPLEAPRGKDVLEVRTPEGEKITTPSGSTGVATFTATDQQGVYEVLSGGKSLSRFAVNLFDAEESRIAIEEKPRLKIGYVDVEARRDWHTARKDLWKLLLLGGLAVLGLEWYIYNRRVYV